MNRDGKAIDFLKLAMMNLAFYSEDTEIQQIYSELKTILDRLVAWKNSK